MPQSYAASPFVQDQTHPLAGRTVLQIIPALDAGGAERTAVDTAGALAAVGARALVACEGGRLVAELQARGGIWVPFPAGEKNPLAMALNVRKLIRLVHTERPALVHARSRAPAWVALAACRLTRTPFMTTYHGAYSGRSPLKLRYNSVMARGDMVVANSLYTRDLIIKNFPWARERLRVVVNGADLRRFTPEAIDPARVERLRTAWGVAPEDRIVLLAARLTGWKGQRVLIEAAARLARQDPGGGTVFVLAGDEQGKTGYVKELDGLIAKAGLEGVIRRVGHCDDMPAAFMAASVVTVPSTEPETFGRVAVEAQSVGTPVVVSDLGAVRETVLAPPETAPEARTGWRVPAGDAEALADAIGAALRLGASARDAMARRARLHVEAHFSVDRMEHDMLDAYAVLLESHAAGSTMAAR
ncbi:glycosyltransferase family 4 protein [Lichenihabitans sp. Uapishka_5]|uniref:glycosyltransferase family 4 protein n=1 Tax=Lichenihabitans sp. Uapishka_5 TaxID=3037302 RepID=UPI0029E7E1B8|nr:glycosyltransferase family 4 protein [Lichenihabitans sp. Uapishka_5]MDX7953937.1 glycosyltransferase family 4 protein [Lichenihabitans sp. Uapishka_5]